MLRVVSPIDGSVVVERPFAGEGEVAAVLARSRAAFASWRNVPLTERLAVCRKFTETMIARKQELGEEITRQMGRPIRYSPRELVTMADRAISLCDLAPAALADIEPPLTPGVKRFIRREPLGVVFAIVPWNYPYLTAVNSVVPALLSGNSMILKPSPQTPLCGERMAEAFAEAGLPSGVFQCLHVSAPTADEIVRSGDIDFVAFTGSVAVGRAVERAAAGRFIGIGLELGGKDAAYVRADADLDHAVENVVDGAFFNSGQSCCAVERAYVHAAVYEPFVERAVRLARAYIVRDPLRAQTTLGPMVSVGAADFVRQQVAEAIAQGAREMVGEMPVPAYASYLGPQVLVDVVHAMRVMRQETFGPVLNVMPVASDDEAIRLVNDSPFGLTASIWTSDPEAAARIGGKLDVGTVYANRCDYLDPLLAWTGTKDSGRGVTLSPLGFAPFTRPKSFYLRG